MKTILRHIERVKEKPHHVRRQVAFTAAGALTAFIAVIWLTASVSTGTFALKETSFAGSASDATLTASETGGTEGLAGAAAASGSAHAPARIEIIDAASSTGPKAEQTTIPF